MTEELFNKEIWKKVIDEGRYVKWGGSPEDRLKRIMLKKLMESREPFYDYLWDKLNETLDLVKELDEQGCKAVREIGTKNAGKGLIGFVNDFVRQTAETAMVEGWALYSGMCETCTSKVCPVIKIIKPEQYDENFKKTIEERQRRSSKKIGIISMSMGLGLPKNIPDEVKKHMIERIVDLFPFKVDKDILREKIESGAFAFNLNDLRREVKSKTLADLLGASEEEVKKWITEQAEKGYTEEAPQ